MQKLITALRDCETVSGAKLKYVYEFEKRGGKKEKLLFIDNVKPCLVL